MFYILLTSARLAEKVGVQKQRQSRMENRSKAERGKTFYLFQMEDLSEPVEPSVPARFSHHYQKDREGGKGKGRGRWRQRVVRMTKVRNI